MSVRMGGVAAVVFHEEDVALADLVDGDHRLNMRLPAGFRVDQVTIIGAENVDGVHLAVGDGDQVDRFGDGPLSSSPAQDLSMPYRRIVDGDVHPVVTVRNAGPEALRAGRLVVRVYGLQVL